MLILPHNNWIEEGPIGSEFEALIPKQSSSLIPSLDLIRETQSWPLKVGWVEYDTEIDATGHLSHLQGLIGPPIDIGDPIYKSI